MECVGARVSRSTVFATQACCTTLQTSKLKAFYCFCFSRKQRQHGGGCADLRPAESADDSCGRRLPRPLPRRAELHVRGEPVQRSGAQVGSFVGPSMFLLRHILILHRESIVIVKYHIFFQRTEPR